MTSFPVVFTNSEGTDDVRPFAFSDSMTTESFYVAFSTSEVP